MIKLWMVAAALLFADSAVGQGCINGIINIYTPVSSFGCDSSVLIVESATGFFPNDKVLLIQMQGAQIDLSNTASFGNITSEGTCGNFEFNRIDNISDNEIRLKFALTRPYDLAGKVQLVRVKEYTDVEACGLTCQPWDGTTGGVLVLDVANTLTLSGDLNVNGTGFQGGKVVYGINSSYHLTDYFYPPWPDQAANKGNGIAAIPDDNSFGRGKSANGGGGGNAHNGGGGGGGNAGGGGNGGLEYYNTPASPTQNTNGIGGMKVFENNLQKVVLGGGGGSGHANDQVGTNGGNGGGIIIIKAKTIQGNNYGLTANGGDVITFGNSNNDGQGGGGAGGTILIEAEQVYGPLQCELKGGRGGDCLFYVGSQIIGAGGGGGGGKLLLSQNFSGIVANLSGGANGIANQNLSNGAMPGETGKVLNGLILPHATMAAQPFQFVFDIALTAPACGNPASGKIEVLNPNVQASSLNGGTFQNNQVYDNLSPGTYTISVQLQNGCERDTTVEMLAPTPVSGSTVSIQDENCKGMGSISISPGTGVPPFEYKLNGGVWGNDTVFANLPAGVYTLTIRDAAGCSGAADYTIQAYDPVEIQLDSLGNIDCTREKGYIAVSAAGGSPPYTFLLENGMPQPTGFFDDLAEGLFAAIVADEDTCEARLEGLIITVSVDSSVAFASIDLCEKTFFVFPNGDSTGTAGVYPIMLTGENGCDSTIIYSIGVMPNNFFIPNVFAPDNYGENEKFTVFTNVGCIQSIQVMRIYDRWGELVFERYDFPPNDIGQGWDGVYKGKKMPSGVYIYYIGLELNNGTVVPRSGDITLIR